MSDPFSKAIDALLSQECTPAVVRRIEQGSDWRPLWSQLVDSGFADALVPESAGGAGLALRDVFGVFERCGAHALPLPFADTVLARALLATTGPGATARPAGPIALATGARHGGGMRCSVVHGAKTATHVIVQAAGTWHLLEVASANAESAGFAIDLSLDWPEDAFASAVPLHLPQPWRGVDVRMLQASAFAALLAGAAARVFDMTLAYANQRVQFGRVIGKFQAVQHHLAVMSQQVAAARMAAEIGCLSHAWAPQPLHAAVAKARASEAALDVARLSHQVHGAIGFTEELDLQLFTRRLHAWRRAGGSESAWQEAVGTALVDEHSTRAVDLACATLNQIPETTQ